MIEAVLLPDWAWKAAGGTAVFLINAGVTRWMIEIAIEAKFVRVFDACSDRIEPRIRTMLNKELVMLTGHDSQLTTFRNTLETGLSQHTIALQSGMAGQTRALEMVAETLEKVQEQASDTALAVARIEGRMNFDRRSGGKGLDDHP